MNEKEIMQLAFEERKAKKSAVAKRLGYASTSSITDMMARKTSARFDMYAKVLDELGYDIVIRDRFDSKKEWTIQMGGDHE